MIRLEELWMNWRRDGWTGGDTGEMQERRLDWRNYG